MKKFLSFVFMLSLCLISLPVLGDILPLPDERTAVILNSVDFMIAFMIVFLYPPLVLFSFKKLGTKGATVFLSIVFFLTLARWSPDRFRDIFFTICLVCFFGNFFFLIPKKTRKTSLYIIFFSLCLLFIIYGFEYIFEYIFGYIFWDSGKSYCLQRVVEECWY